MSGRGAVLGRLDRKGHLTPAGRETLEDDRDRRVGWLVSAIEELPARDQAVLARATAIIGRLAERPD